MGRKSRYPLEEKCLAQRKNEAEPCQNPRRTCRVHCNANLKNPGDSPFGRCAKIPETVTLRCRIHGGVPQIGVSNPNFRHGGRSRYSSVLTGTNLGRFEDALSDPAHIEMREQLALLDMMLIDALERAQLGRTGELWEELTNQAHRFKIAQRRDDQSGAADALNAIFEVVENGAQAHRAMVEAANLIERQRKVKDSERKRIVDEQQSISATRALTFASTVFEIVRKHITGNPHERELLTGISRELAGLVQQDVPGARELPPAPNGG